MTLFVGVFPYRIGALFSLVVNVAFIITWTIQGIAVEYDKRHIYELPSQWWRIMLFVRARCKNLSQKPPPKSPKIALFSIVSSSLAVKRYFTCVMMIMMTVVELRS